MKKLMAILMALALVLSVASVAVAAGETYKIGVLVWKYNDTFGSTVRKAMEEAKDVIGAELGVTIELNMVDANDVMATQIEQAPTLFQQNDFVIVNLADVSAGESITAIAAENPDTPYLFYNKQPSAETVVDVVKDTIFIGTLARQAGDMQGEILYDLYTADPSIDKNNDGKLQYVVFKGEPANDEAQARSKYCVETAIACGLELEAVTTEQVANWDTAQAQEKMDAVWAAHPETEVVFCNNDDMAIGVIASLNAAGYNTGLEGDPSIVVIGVDATDAAMQAIADGTMTATVKQDGNAMGYANIRVAMNMLLGNDWLDGLDYEYADDEFTCIRIPYAKITAA